MGAFRRVSRPLAHTANGQWAEIHPPAVRRVTVSASTYSGAAFQLAMFQVEIAKRGPIAMFSGFSRLLST
jgi:hypothetical protein